MAKPLSKAPAVFAECTYFFRDTLTKSKSPRSNERTHADDLIRFALISVSLVLVFENLFG